MSEPGDVVEASEPVAILFRGFCGKKNRKAPNANGRGLHIEPHTREMIQRMELQVPSWARDRRLDNPEVEWFITYTNARVDVDGIITTVLDILQRYGVIVNDDIAHFGGKQTIWPPLRGEEDTVTVVLTPHVEDPVSPRYIDPKRRRRLSVVPAPSGPPESAFTDTEDDSWWGAAGATWDV
jgi:hypothetical protein